MPGRLLETDVAEPSRASGDPFHPAPRIVGLAPCDASATLIRPVRPKEISLPRPILPAALLAAVLSLSACAEMATLPPALSAEERQAYHVEQVVVTVPDDARIWWGTGDRQVAEAAGVDYDDGAASDYLHSPEGEAALREALRERFQRSASFGLRNMLAGEAPAALAIEVRNLQVASAAQKVLIGGSHGIEGAVQLFDMRNGQPISEPQYMLGDATGGSGIAGAIIDASRDDAFNRVAANFVQNTQRWVRASAPIEMPWTASANKAVAPLPAPPPPDIPESPPTS